MLSRKSPVGKVKYIFIFVIEIDEINASFDERTSPLGHVALHQSHARKSNYLFRFDKIGRKGRCCSGDNMTRSFDDERSIRVSHPLALVLSPGQTNLRIRQERICRTSRGTSISVQPRASNAASER